MLPPQEQINLYIAERPEWQRRLLVQLRRLIHSVDEDITEAWRSNAPTFEHEGVIVSLHAGKTHVAAWFHQGDRLKDTHKAFVKEEKEDKAIRKIKLEEGDALNEKAFVDLVKQAVKLNQGDARPGRKLVVPADLELVLKKDEQAWERWEDFSYAHKKEYVEWITDAKQEEIRKRRIAQALEMIREGAALHDKHSA